jgi:hypothetical protein
MSPKMAAIRAAIAAAIELSCVHPLLLEATRVCQNITKNAKACASKVLYDRVIERMLARKLSKNARPRVIVSIVYYLSP